MTARRPEGVQVREARLLLTLTFATGVVDAVGYLALDRVFAGNMTGNTVMLGVGVVGADGLRPGGPALALVAFWLGAQICGRALAAGTTLWSTRISALIAATGLGVGGVAVLLLLFPPSAYRAAALVAALLLGACMGLQAATARQLGVADVPTVIIDEQVIGLASDAGRRRRQPWQRRVGSVLALASGAFVGALLAPGPGLVLAATLALGVAVLGQILFAGGSRAPA